MCGRALYFDAFDFLFLGGEDQPRDTESQSGSGDTKGGDCTDLHALGGGEVVVELQCGNARLTEFLLDAGHLSVDDDQQRSGGDDGGGSDADADPSNDAPCVAGWGGRLCGRGGFFEERQKADRDALIGVGVEIDGAFFGGEAFFLKGDLVFPGEELKGRGGLAGVGVSARIGELKRDPRGDAFDAKGGLNAWSERMESALCGLCGCAVGILLDAAAVIFDSIAQIVVEFINATDKVKEADAAFFDLGRLFVGTGFGFHIAQEPKGSFQFDEAALVIAFCGKFFALLEEFLDFFTISVIALLGAERSDREQKDRAECDGSEDLKKTTGH